MRLMRLMFTGASYVICVIYSESREVLPGEVSEGKMCLSPLLNKIIFTDACFIVRVDI